MVRPHRAKNDEGRTFYFDSELRAIVTNLWQNRNPNCPNVFTNNGKSFEAFRFTWNRACRTTGLGYGYAVRRRYVEKCEEEGLKPGPTLHDFRRTAVRNLVRSGVPESVAMKISGHKTRSVFDRYNITSEDHIRQAVKRQEANLNSKAKSDTKQALRIVVSR